MARDFVGSVALGVLSSSGCAADERERDGKRFYECFWQMRSGWVLDALQLCWEERRDEEEAKRERKETKKAKESGCLSVDFLSRATPGTVADNGG